MKLHNTEIDLTSYSTQIKLLRALQGTFRSRTVTLNQMLSKEGKIHITISKGEKVAAEALKNLIEKIGYQDVSVFDYELGKQQNHPVTESSLIDAAETKSFSFVII